VDAPSFLHMLQDQTCFLNRVITVHESPCSMACLLGARWLMTVVKVLQVRAELN